MWRRALAMVVTSESRSRLIAVLRGVAMARGALPVCQSPEIVEGSVMRPPPWPPPFRGDWSH